MSENLFCVCETGREEDFKKSAHGRAAQAQLQQMAKQSANTNKGEPVLKVLFPPQLSMYYYQIYNIFCLFSLIFFFFLLCIAVANDIVMGPA